MLVVVVVNAEFSHEISKCMPTNIDDDLIRLGFCAMMNDKDGCDIQSGFQT